MRKCGNEKMWKWENEEEATRIALAEGLLVYSTLAKFKTLPKFEMKKRCVGGVLGGFGRKRRRTEES